MPTGQTYLVSLFWFPPFIIMRGAMQNDVLALVLQDLRANDLESTYS